MEVTDAFMFAVLKGLSATMMIIPPFCGVAVGVRLCSEGICKAAEYAVDLTYTIIPMAFLTAPALYGILAFFISFGYNVDNYKNGFVLLAGSMIQGFTGGFAGYAVGSMIGPAAITRVQQKKFNTSFLLLLLFAELLGLFGCLCGILFIVSFSGNTEVK